MIYSKIESEERMMRVADNIRHILRERNLSQCKVAEAAGFTQQAFSNMLCGRKQIKIEYIPQICNAMGVTPNELFYRV